MALHITYSNSFTVLLTALNVNLDFDKANGKESLFDPIEIVVPGKEIEAAVLRKLCEKSGISVGFHFSNLAEWLRPYGAFWHTASLESFKLPWSLLPILFAIQGKKQDQLHCPLTNYAQLLDVLEGKSELEVFSLAERIARVFTKYVNYRYDWVTSWIDDARKTEDDASLAKQPEFLWQKSLWQELHAIDELRERESEMPFASSYTGKILTLSGELLGKTDSRYQAPVDTSPVHIFLPHTLPPLAFPVLAKQAQTRDVRLYIFNPCCEYWFDPNDAVPLALFHGKKSEPGWKVPQKINRFLHENATSVRAFIDRLWRYAPDEGLTSDKIIEDSFTRPKDDLVAVSKMRCLWKEMQEKVSEDINGSDQSMIWRKRIAPNGQSLTLLDAIANSFLFDCPLKGNGEAFSFDIDEFDAKKDQSFRIFKATSLSSQIEATIDWIDALSEKHHYKADDFLVVTPNITAAAGLVRGLLNARDPEHRIDYKILGEVNVEENAFLEAFSFLFEKSDFDSFLELISTPLFMQAWLLTFEEIEILRNWLATAGFRLGVNAEHLDSLARETVLEENDTTLARALERLALGFAYDKTGVQSLGRSLAVTGDELTAFETVSKDSELFAKLLTMGEVLKGLVNYAKEIQRARFRFSASEWKTFTLKLLEDLFPEEHSNKVREAKEVFTEALDGLHETITSTLEKTDELISPEVYRASLERTLGVTIRHSRHDGAVTFASMDALRDIPFKAIAMVGLDEDSQFPGEQVQEEFDLTCAYRHREDAPKPRRGDQDSRIDNRAVFLGLLCAAEKHVLITYNAGEKPLDKPKGASSVLEDLTQWLSEEAPGLVEKISGILPASRFTLTSFFPALKENHSSQFFSNRNRKEYEALVSSLRESNKTEEKAPAEDFLRGFDASKKDEETLRTVLFRKLCKAWIDPTEYVLQKLRLTVGLDDELTVSRILPPDLSADKLRKTQLQRLLRRELDIRYPKLKSDSHKEVIVNELCNLPLIRLNPTLGCQAVREYAVKNLVGTIYDYKKIEETIAPNGTEKLDVGFVTFDAVRLRLPAIDILCETKESKTIDFLYSAYSARDCQRAALLQIALLASDYAKETGKRFRLRLVYEKDNVVSEITFERGTEKQPYADLSEIEPENAQALIAQFLRYEEALSTRFRVTPTPPYHGPNAKKTLPALDPLWRGFEKLKKELEIKKGSLDGAYVFSLKEGEKQNVLINEAVTKTIDDIEELLNKAQDAHNND